MDGHIYIRVQYQGGGKGSMAAGATRTASFFLFDATFRKPVELVAWLRIQDPG